MCFMTKAAGDKKKKNKKKLTRDQNWPPGQTLDMPDLKKNKDVHLWFYEPKNGT